MKKLIGYFLKKGADDFSKSSGAFLKKMPSFLETGFEVYFSVDDDIAQSLTNMY